MRTDPAIVDYDKARDQFITQKYVTSRYLSYEDNHHQTSAFISLPEELIMIIFSFLPHSDIITMAVTCKSIAEFVNRNFVPSLTLPISPHNLRKLDGRYVLSLKSTYNIMILQKYKKGEYLKNLEKVRIERLQKLVFVLYKYSNEDRLTRNHFLPPLYKDILSKYLSKSKELTHLHVAIDRSKETFDMIDVIATTLPHLTKVVLQANDTPNNVPFFIDNENTQFFKMVPHYKSLALNVLLGRLLKNTAIRSLEIIGLDMYHTWDRHIEYGPLYPLAIYSDYLQHLQIVQDAFCYISLIVCPELLEIKYIDFGAEDLKCLVHHKIFKVPFDKCADLRSMVYACPKLERINKIDIKAVRSHLLDKYSCDEWYDHLTEICPCESADDEDDEDEF